VTNLESKLDEILENQKKIVSDMTAVGDTVDKDLNELKHIFNRLFDGVDKMNEKLSTDHLLFVKIFQILFEKEPDMEALIDEAKKQKPLYI